MIKRIGKSFCVIFLLAFMTLIFGPAEIFFVNYGEFKFVYGEFAIQMALIALAGSAIGAIIFGVLPEKVNRFLNAIVFGVSVAGYIQVMFINKGLDLLGMNPEGYTPEKSQAIVNAVFWVCCILVSMMIGTWKSKIWDKVVLYLSIFLFLIQGVAYVSLALQADEAAYSHKADGQWYISGKDQFTVSGKDNIVVFILDYFSNQYLESTMEAYPDLLDDYADFTYYNNADCTYFGTYPSLAHMFSGQDVDNTISINEWTKNIWKNEMTVDFYQKLRDKNYVSNVYTPDKNMLCGMNDVDTLIGTFSNISNGNQDLIIDYKLLVKTMTKISGYRFLPYAVKPRFYVQVNGYMDVVQSRENEVIHNNAKFNTAISERGLIADDKNNYYIVQHLMGPHLYETAFDGTEKEDSTKEETIKGCMTIVSKYMQEMKRLGVYDNATIIITADHGGPRDSQVAYFVKEAGGNSVTNVVSDYISAGSNHAVLPVKKAPISHDDYLATIAHYAGIDSSKYGRSITEIGEDELRERTVWVRDYKDDLPPVQRYIGETTGVSNVYCGYTYTGNIEDLFEKYDSDEPDIILPEFDSFF